MNKKDKLHNELQFCLTLWQKQGYCEFGGCTKCQECAALYVLWKLMTGKMYMALIKKNSRCMNGKIYYEALINNNTLQQKEQ